MKVLSEAKLSLQKIIQGLVKIKMVDKKLFLGNLYAKRDWGHARDQERQCGKCCNKEKPNDYVIKVKEKILSN